MLLFLATLLAMAQDPDKPSEQPAGQPEATKPGKGPVITKPKPQDPIKELEELLALAKDRLPDAAREVQQQQEVRRPAPLLDQPRESILIVVPAVSPKIETEPLAEQSPIAPQTPTE